jgi:ABC-type sugar transport system substrate-binding protein
VPPDARDLQSTRRERPTKKIVLGLALAAMMSTSAMAAKIGVSIINFDNNFQNLLKQGMEARAKELGVDIQVEDAQNDVGKQLDQVKNFIANGVDATQDALQAMKAGDLDITVFQNAKAQGGGGIDTAVALTKGEKVSTPVYVPFELVTPANMDNYLTKN